MMKQTPSPVKRLWELAGAHRRAYGLRRLTDRQRFAIELAFWEGYQYKEIAVIFGCSPAAVTLLLQRAFHRLRSFLAE